jgi:hypothetical protein
LPTELVTNGDFSNGGTGWTTGGTVNFTGDKANLIGNQSNIFRFDVIELNKRYTLTFDVVDLTDGFVRAYLANTSSGNLSNIYDASSIGTHTVTFDYLNNTLLRFSLFGTGSASIDNVSVKEIQEADFDFVRATTATRVNALGLIEEVAAGIPRIDYSSGVGQWLFEPARTNLVTYSEAFTGYWATQSANVTAASGIIAPDGSENVISLNTTTTATFCGLNRVEATAFTNKTLSLSVFAKKITSDYIFFYNIGSVGGVTAIYFNINNGTLGTIGVSWSNAKIEDYGDGWYRCSATLSYDAAGTDYIYIFQSDNNANPESTLGKQTYLYGSQLEEGSYATSYIPTNGSTKTRNADVANNSGNADLFNDSEGVLYAEIAALANDGTFRRISVSDGTNTGAVDPSNSIQIYYRTDANKISWIVVNGGANQAGSVLDVDALNLSKISLKYKANDFALWINGFEVATDTSGSTPSGLTTLQFNGGNSVGAYPFYGKTKELMYFPEALTDLDLETVTSWSSFELMKSDLNYV